MTDTSGPSSPTPLAFYDPASSSWRTSQGCFPWEESRSLETLPASGMTLGGRLFERPTLAHATAAPGSSFLPTPSSIMDAEGTTYRNPRADANFETHHAVTLSQVAYKRFHDDLDGGMDLLPTPTRRDHQGHNQRHDETCLTGALTAPPSPATPPCSDDLHPTLWTDEGD